MSTDVKYSQIGYTFIFDRQMNCLYCDSGSMAERLKSCRSIKNAMEVNKGSFRPFEYRFSFGKVRYRAVFTPFFASCYICSVYPEDSYLRCVYSEFYKSIFYLRTLSAVSVSETQLFEESIITNSDEEKYGGYTAGEKERSEKMLLYSSSLLKMLDNEHIVEYIPISERIENSCKAIGKSTDILNKKIEFDIDIRQSVARMNYILFEAALSGIARIIYGFMLKDDNACIRISGKPDGTIEINGSYEAGRPLDNNISEHDKGVLKCIIECLSGRSTFTLSERKFTVNAVVPAALSNYSNRVKNAGMYKKQSEEVEYDPLGLAGLFTSVPEKNARFHAPEHPYNVDVSTLLCNIAMQKYYEKLVS